MSFFNEKIIEFWIKYSIKISSCSDKFFYVDATLLACYDINAMCSINEFYDSTENENVCFFLVNTSTIHWQLIVIVNALDNEKMKVILFFDSSVSQFDPRKIYHMSLETWHETCMLESVFCTSF